MDIGNGYFMAKFEHEEHRNEVINGGPWMIFNQYLSLRTRTVDFNASTATIDNTMVWVRIPSLNYIWYDESFLWTLASAVGKLVKVDLHTLRVARGNFARVCVEVALNHSVVGRVGVQEDGIMWSMRGSTFFVPNVAIMAICLNIVRLRSHRRR